MSKIVKNVQKILKNQEFKYLSKRPPQQEKQEMWPEQLEVIKIQGVLYFQCWI